jgi:hypothetical protein
MSQGFVLKPSGGSWELFYRRTRAVLSLTGPAEAFDEIVVASLA